MENGPLYDTCTHMSMHPLCPIEKHVMYRISLLGAITWDDCNCRSGYKREQRLNCLVKHRKASTRSKD